MNRVFSDYEQCVFWLWTEEDAACGVLFPEFEVEMEEEDYSPAQAVEDEEEALPECNQHVPDEQASQPGAAPGTQYSEEDLPYLEGFAAQETDDRRQFRKFQKRVAHNKDQVRFLCGYFALLRPKKLKTDSFGA